MCTRTVVFPHALADGCSRISAISVTRNRASFEAYFHRLPVEDDCSGTAAQVACLPHRRCNLLWHLFMPCGAVSNGACCLRTPRCRKRSTNRFNITFGRGAWMESGFASTEHCLIGSCCMRCRGKLDGIRMSPPLSSIAKASKQRKLIALLAPLAAVTKEGMWLVASVIFLLTRACRQRRAALDHCRDPCERTRWHVHDGTLTTALRHLPGQRLKVVRHDPASTGCADYAVLIEHGSTIFRHLLRDLHVS